MNIPLRVLIVEDSEFDTLILVNVLRKGGYNTTFKRVDTRETMLAALAEGQWDIVLSDYNMPAFSMSEALQLLKNSGLDLPFVIVSGGIGEDTAVAAMKAGAHDYLMKGNLARLAPAVARELREAASRAARRKAEEALRESELRYRMLWETSTDAVLLVDTDGHIHFANPAVETVFGYRPDELIGQTLSLLQPESLRARHIEGARRYLQAPSKKTKGPTFETIGMHKEGHPIAIEIAFSELELHKKRWLVAFIRDITERKKAEKALQENQEQFRVAREIQQRLFPKSAPTLAGFDLAGASYPAEAAGGDYFDFLSMVDGQVGIVVGDVTGHGIGPAMLMAETRAYLRILAKNRSDLPEILSRANRMLSEDISSDRFVTLMLAKLDPVTRSLVYASAGHPPSYVLDASGALKGQLKRTGLPLGIQPEAKYNAAAPIALAPGDVVVLLTDGIEEAMSPEDEFFSRERLIEIVRANRQQSAKEIVESLYKAVRDFSKNAPQLDDVTVVVVKVMAED